MLTPVAVPEGPSPKTAGSTTRHISWAAPTQPASPGSIGVPDAPRSTSTSTAEATPAGVQTAKDPVLPTRTATGPLDRDPRISSGGPVGDPHEPKQQSGNINPVDHFGSHTLEPGGLVVTVNNIPYSFTPSAAALVSNGHTTPLAPKPGDSPKLTINGVTILPDTPSRVLIGHEELLGGGPTVTISGTPYALAPSGTALVAGSSTIAIRPQGTNDDENPIAPNLRGGKTTSQRTGLALVIGSATSTLYPSAQGQPPIITVNSNRYTLDPSSVFIIGTQTLAPGKPAITINSTIYSLHPVAALPTFVAPPSSSNASLPTAGEAVVTVASHVYTCHQNSPCTIGSQVLRPNGSISVGADRVVYREGGIDVVRESKVVVTPSKGEVKTSHISGLTPIGEETAPAPAAAGGADESGG
ncbi:MAG: hypothetical protein Q9224_004083, partial [Gallowayella concinna]